MTQTATILFFSTLLANEDFREGIFGTSAGTVDPPSGVAKVLIDAGLLPLMGATSLQSLAEKLVSMHDPSAVPPWQLVRDAWNIIEPPDTVSGC